MLPLPAPCPPAAPRLPEPPPFAQPAPAAAPLLRLHLPSLAGHDLLVPNARPDLILGHRTVRMLEGAPR